MGLFSGISKAFKSVTGLVKDIAAPITDIFGGDIFSSLISGGASLMGGSAANSATAASTLQQMQFQKEMSSTAYQRAMADMEKSGLNPMLAYSQGGASTPAGASYQAADTSTPAVQSAQAASRLHTDLQLRRQQLLNAKEENSNLQLMGKKIDADTGVANSQAGLNSYMSAKAKQDTLTSAASARSLDASTHITRLNAPEAAANAALFSSAVGPAQKAAEKFLPGAHTAAQAGQAFKSIIKKGR